MRTNGIYPPSVKPGIPKLGECPKGWKICRFGDVLEVVERKAILEDDAEYQLVIAKRNRGGIEPRVRLRGAEIRTKTQQLIAAGDFLISRRQIIHGACGLVPPSLDGALVSNEYTTLLPKDGVLLAEYLAFFSHSLHFQQTCFHSSVGVDVEKMVFRLPKWLHHKLLLPRLPEQERIAEVLGAWDRAIGLTDRLIEAKQRLKKGLMQQLLTGRLRFPQFGKPARKHGELPKGWKMKPISSVAQVSFSGVDKKSHPDETPVQLCNYMDVYGNDYITPDLDFMQATASASEIASFRLLKGDVLITKDSETPDDIGVPAVVTEDLKGVVCGYHLALIRPNPEKADPVFLAKELGSSRSRRHFSTHANGATRFGLSNGAVKKAQIHLPPIDEQKALAAALYACDREIQLLIRKRDCLQQQKRGLMQKLLTGEVRMPVNGRKHNVS